MDFNTWMYHKQHGAQLFETEDEFANAGNGWVDSPAKLAQAVEVPAPAPTPAPSSDAEKPEVDAQPLDRDALKARADELGVTYPRNIGTEKLAALVAAAA